MLGQHRARRKHNCCPQDKGRQAQRLSHM
jgi:hypothetical protein